MNNKRKIKINKGNPIYYENICPNWYEASKDLVVIQESNQSDNLIFAQFFFLWSSFNALYNLAGPFKIGEINRMEGLIDSLDDEDTNKFFEETKNSCDYFIKERDLIKDMKRYLHKEEPLEKMDIHVIRKNYEENRNTKENLKNIIGIIYRVRNNLTHGSKEMRGDDILIIKKAIPILKSATRIIAKRVFDVSL
jgi:hypothetical protein